MKAGRSKMLKLARVPVDIGGQFIFRSFEYQFTWIPQVSLSRLAMLEPPVPPSSCSAPELPPRPSCTAQPGLTGDLLPRPRKLVVMILFSFEVMSRNM